MDATPTGPLPRGPIRALRNQPARQPAPQRQPVFFIPLHKKKAAEYAAATPWRKKRLNAAFSRLPWRPCAYGAGREPCRETLATQGFLRICRTPPGGLLLSLRDNSPCAAKADESLRGGKAERRQWREERGGSPVSKGAPGRPHGPTQRDLCELWEPSAASGGRSEAEAQ